MSVSKFRAKCVFERVFSGVDDALDSRSGVVYYDFLRASAEQGGEGEGGDLIFELSRIIHAGSVCQ
jgi:hypothetical protein